MKFLEKRVPEYLRESENLNINWDSQTMGLKQTLFPGNGETMRKEQHTESIQMHLIIQKSNLQSASLGQIIGIEQRVNGTVSSPSPKCPHHQSGPHEKEILGL